MYGSVVREGNNFYRMAMEIDKRKREYSKIDLEHTLTRLATEFVAKSALDLDVSVSFCDVHHLMGKLFHTELCYVKLNKRRCDLFFHDRLLEFTDPNAGLVFFGKCWVLFLVLDAALSEANNLSLEFVFEIGDCGSLDQVCFTSTDPSACLILDFQFAESNGYEAFRNYASRHLPGWGDRKRQVFWRGSTTGARLFQPPGPSEPDDLDWLQRLRLCKSADAPSIRDLCDVGISRIVQVPEPHLVERIEASGMLKSGVPRETFSQYRCVFDIDGNANAWSGLFCSLLGGSCVLKVASQRGFLQWYYGDLVPWVNFVPILADLSDLNTGVEWCSKHDYECQEIASRGRELALGIDMARAVKESAKNFITFALRQKLHPSFKGRL